MARTLLLSLLLAAGCGGDADTTRATGDGAGGPAVNPYAGTYGTAGTWDLSGPFAGDHTLGYHVAELLISELVGTLGVPSALEDEAHELLADLVADPIKEVVDARAPATLAPGGAIREALAVTFATVDVRGSIDLAAAAANATSLSGVEHISSITVPGPDGGTVDVPLDVIALDDETVSSVSADLDVSVVEPMVLDVARHPFQLRFERLVSWALTEVATDEATGIAEGVVAAVECDSLVARLLSGDDELPVDVAGQRFAVGTGALDEACSVVHQAVTDRVIGLFRKDTGVEVGGRLTATDDDGDGVADRLESQEGYGGEFTPFPASLDPVVGVSFSGTRTR